LKGQFAEHLLPAVTKLLGFFTRHWKSLNAAAQGVDKLRVAAVLLTPVLAALAVKGMLALANPLTLAIAGFVALALVVEDLIGSYETGDGAVRDFFLAHTDIDVVKIMDELVDGWYFLQAAIESTPDSLAGFVESWMSGFRTFNAGITQALGFVASLVEMIERLSPGWLMITRAAGVQGAAPIRALERAAQGATNVSAEAAHQARLAAVGAPQRITARRQDALQRGAQARQVALASRANQAALRSVQMTQDVVINATGMSPEQARSLVRVELDRANRDLADSVDAGAE
jgi:hypothetical protein